MAGPGRPHLGAAADPLRAPRRLPRPGRVPRPGSDPAGRVPLPVAGRGSAPASWSGGPTWTTTCSPSPPPAPASSGQDGQASGLPAGEFTFYDCVPPARGQPPRDDDGRGHATSIVALIPYGALPLPPEPARPAVRPAGCPAARGSARCSPQYLTRITGAPGAVPCGRRRAGSARSALDLITTHARPAPGRRGRGADRGPPPGAAGPGAGVRPAAPGRRRRSARASSRDAHHISVRSLHRLFEDEETTVASYIRDLRLARCRRDLADPALADRPVQADRGALGFPGQGPLQPGLPGRPCG